MLQPRATKARLAARTSSGLSSVRNPEDVTNNAGEAISPTRTAASPEFVALQAA